MKFLEKTDSEILSIAEPILQDIISGTNAKDWKLFSKHMLTEQALDPKIRESVEKQWEESEWLTSLTTSPEFLGVIRKSDSIIVLWKQNSTKSQEEYLEKLTLVEIDGIVKEAGIWLE